MSKKLLILAVVMVLALVMMVCREKKTIEKVMDAAKSAKQTVDDAAKSTGKAVDDAAKSTGKAVDDVAKSTGKAVDDAAKSTIEYMSQSKDMLVKAANETLTEIEKKWHDLQAKAAPTTDKAKAGLRKVKEQMAKVLADAKAKLIDAKDASSEAWQQNIKPALDTALQNAQALYDDAVAEFGSK